MSVESDIRAFLLLAGTCVSAKTYVGPPRKAGGTVPVDAVFVIEYGGPKPHGFMNPSVPDTYRKNDVQVWVRGAPKTYLQTKALADSIWRTLNRPSNASVSSSTVTYVRIEPMTSAPLWLGESDQERPEFSINVRVESHV